MVFTPPDGVRALDRFLRDGGPLPDAPTLARTHLAPLAYTRLAADDPRRARLRDAFTRATARHLANKVTFLPLARAWRDAGIDVVVFKGFYLAELVYEHPAQRHYNDIDVLVRPETWDQAEAIATELGWTVTWRRRDSLYRWSHEEAILTNGTAEIEAHRFVIDCNSRNDSWQRRITAAAWAGSTEVPWEGTTMRTLAPVDSLLMGLVLARAWSAGDDWHLKPADYPDLGTLASAIGVSLDDARARASELECARTFELVLQRCDPWRGVLDLEPPRVRHRRRWYREVAPERGHLGVERVLVKLRRLPGTLADMVRQFPRLLRVQRALGREEAPRSGPATEGSLPRQPVGTALAAKEHIVRGVKWGARLVALGRDPCRLRSRALFDALRTTPFPVRLYEGRAFEGGRLHAWIEVDGVVLRDLHDVRPCAVERAVACYRSDSSGSDTDPAEP